MIGIWPFVRVKIPNFQSIPGFFLLTIDGWQDQGLEDAKEGWTISLMNHQSEMQNFLVFEIVFKMQT